MSDTPETNALANEIYARGIRVIEIRMLQHARKLERERNKAIERIRDMLECDDGQAFKEVRKFLEGIDKSHPPTDRLTSREDEIT